MTGLSYAHDLTGAVPALAVRGTLVTMAAADVIESGTVYIRDRRIVDVRPSAAPAPDGFPPGAPLVDTQAIVYPGLIDLHNHLPYNILTLWHPPQQFRDRGQWRSHPKYKQAISEPMRTLRDKGGLSVMRAIVRYIEVKLLMGGVTSGQGMSSPAETFKGLVRNFEAPDEGLPKANAEVNDLANLPSDKLAAFTTNLLSGNVMFHHVAEGVDGSVRSTFLRLKQDHFLRDNLAAIHCLDLEGQDFAMLAGRGVSVVWSPLSNCSLYGSSLNPRTLREAHVRVGFGSDWTPSGSRNLLLELKVARLLNTDGGFSDRELATMATRDGAAIAGWGSQLGTLERGKLADLTVLTPRHPNPFENLLTATERDVRLVVIDGQPRYGDPPIFGTLSIPPSQLESLTVGGVPKQIYLSQPGSALEGLTFAEARNTLEQAMGNLQALRAQETLFVLGLHPSALLELDMQSPDEDGGAALFAKEELPLLPSVPLDPVAIAGDSSYFDALDAVEHVPAILKGPNGLRRFY